LNTPDYLVFLEKELQAYADPIRSEKMSRYMKNLFPFFGIPSPLRKELLRLHLLKHGNIPDENLEEIVAWCWNAAEREWQYNCMELLGRRAKKESAGIIETYEKLIVQKSWWDSVDYLASNLVGTYFRNYPGQIQKHTSAWMGSGNIWLQRTCLLFQLKYKATTDVELLSDFIKQLKDSQEFFIRKAIGWSLRELSKTNPEFVISFVNNTSISGLSEREALKWLRAKKRI
jgi:3-methyladenine DNA glycosylase AlkD